MLERSHQACLFADDTALFAPDGSEIKKSLDVLVEGCRDGGLASLESCM